MTVIVSLVVALALFGVAFFSRRRFGVLGLALAAGALLADQMTQDVSRLIASNKIPVEPLSTLSAASIFLILLPALILLFGGPMYKKREHIMVSAAAFTFMAMILLLGSLTNSLPPDKLVEPLLTWVTQYKSVLLAVMIAAAVVDVWLTRSRSSTSEEAKEKK